MPNRRASQPGPSYPGAPGVDHVAENGSTAANATRVVRTTARVFPVDHDDRVLLLHGRDPARPERPYWFTIGGGVEPGEGLIDAARRELFEESGLRMPAAAFVGPFHIGRHRYSFAGVEAISIGHFFAIEVAQVEVTLTGLVGSEVGNVLAFGWGMPDELRSLPLSNRRLSDLAANAVMIIRRSREGMVK